MGVTAERLGYPDAAEELIRAGWAYATAIDHQPLLAQLRQQLSYVMFWRGRTVESRDLATSGLQYLSQGPAGADLYLKYARAAARLGDADAARQAITDAHDAREREYNDDLLEIGGEFAVSLATHHGFAGAALAEIEGGEREAAEELERAVSLYDAGPGPGEQHWFGGKALAGIDLAAIRLRSGALDAAVSALEPVLTLLPAQRITALTTRLTLVRTELAAPIFRGSAQAHALDERIEDFGREAITTALHSLPGPS
jgi:tetratricopeptide (TPR) repeat protein